MLSERDVLAGKASSADVTLRLEALTNPTFGTDSLTKCARRMYDVTKPCVRAHAPANMWIY